MPARRSGQQPDAADLRVVSASTSGRSKRHHHVMLLRGQPAIRRPATSQTATFQTATFQLAGLRGSRLRESRPGSHHRCGHRHWTHRSTRRSARRHHDRCYPERTAVVDRTLPSCVSSCAYVRALKSVEATLLGGLYESNVRRRPTLPQPPGCSTIGAERLDFRVRNGAGYFPFAMAAETLWSYV